MINHPATHLLPQRLDRIISTTFFPIRRNICAHDERLYCARPHDRNASVWQLIQDFMLVVDKKRYQEFLQKICSLIGYLRKCLPGYWDVIVREMGFTDFESEMSELMSKIEKL